MSEQKPNDPEDQYTTWLAACDDALAAGTPTPILPSGDSTRARDDLACARILREVLGELPGLAVDFGSAQAEAGFVPWRTLGRFQLQRELGRGGCGVVFLALDKQLGREVALKVPHVEAALSPELRERFHREARAASSLDHANIVPVHEVGEVGPVSYIVSAYCPGPTLADWLKARSEPIPFRDAATLIAALADTVAHAHARGVVHRDLKPGNILLTPNSKSEIRNPKSEIQNSEYALGQQVSESKAIPPIASDYGFRISDYCPKITDFGLAKLVESSGDAPTRTGMILGTARYMAPEQAEGKVHAVGPAADIYALGAILYELLTGRPPFQGESELDTMRQVQRDEPVPPSRLRYRTPRDLQTICLKCLRKEPNLRYESAAALAEDLRRYLDNRPILARRPSQFEVTWRWIRRNPTVSLLAASILTLLVAATIGSLLAAARLRDAERDKTRELVRSLVAQVRAKRQIGQPGRRLDGLEILAKAVQLRAELGEPEDLPTVKELRDEMIGCLALTDMRPVHRWPGYPTGSWRLAFDGDLQRYAVGYRDMRLRVARVTDDEELVTFTDTASSDCDPRLLRLSPDGQFVALIRWRDPRARLWDVERQESIQLDTQPVNDSSGLAFDRTSRRLAIGHPNGTVSIHELPSGRLLRRLSRAGQPGVSFVAFDPAGQRVAVARVGGRVVEIYGLGSGDVERRLSHTAITWDLGWSDDGARLAVNCDSSGILIWDTRTGRIAGTVPGHSGAGGVRVGFLPGSELLGSVAWDDQMRLWHVPSGREVFHMTSSVNSECFQFSRDGRAWASKVEGSEISTWQVAQSKEYRSLRSVAGWRRGNSTRGGAIGLDGRLLALCSAHGVHLWDLTSGQDVALLPAGPAYAVAFSPRHDSIFVYGHQGLVRWPITRSNELPGHVMLGPPEKIPLGFGESLSASADGRLLAAAVEGGVKVLDLNRAGGSTPLYAQRNTLYVALSPNGRWVASGTKHGIGVMVWELADGRELGPLCKEQTEHTVAFSPDSRWFVAGAIGEYRFWKTDSWDEGIHVSSDCGTVPGPIAFSPDSRMVALETAHARISLVDPETGEEFARLEDPSGHRPTWMGFAPDGSRLVVASQQYGAIFVWELHLLREQLAGAGLDRGLPPWPAPSEASDKPITWELSFQLDADALCSRGDVAFALRDLVSAEADYREVLREQPEHAPACNELAWLYVMSPPQFRKPCEALTLALEAVRQNPQSEYLNTLGVVYYRLGRWQEAIETLEKAVRANRRKTATPWDAFFLAASHHRLGHRAEARRYYDQALALRATYQTSQLHEPLELDEMQAEAQVVLGQTPEK